MPPFKQAAASSDDLCPSALPAALTLQTLTITMHHVRFNRSAVQLSRLFAVFRKKSPLHMEQLFATGMVTMTTSGVRKSQFH